MAETKTNGKQNGYGILTKAGAVEALQNGSIGTIGRYWGSIIESMQIRDKTDKSGPRINRIVVKHTVMCGRVPVVCGEWLPDGTKESDVKLPEIKELAPVLIVIRSCETRVGQVGCSGELIIIQG